MNTDLPLFEQRWETASVALEKAGIDISKLRFKTDKVRLLARLEADEVIGSDEDAWREYAEGLVTDHPTWAKPGFWRRTNAAQMIDEYGQDWNNDSTDALDDMAQCKYAVVCYIGGHHNHYVRGAKDKQGIAEIILACQGTEVEIEYIDEIMDLDTGEYININYDVEIIVTLPDDDIRVSNKED